MNEAMKLAIENGYQLPIIRGWKPYPDFTAFMLQDPAFWQALSKALGWRTLNEDCVCENCVEFKSGKITLYHPDKSVADRSSGHSQTWLYYALRYHELVLTGGDLEAFWKDLLKN